MGHAYYANYLYWLEQARAAWCRDRGFTYKSLEEAGIFLPVVEVHLRYRGEIKYDDWITVKVWLEEVRRASIHFKYEIVNESSGNRVTEAYTWHVWMGTNRKANSISEEYVQLLSRNPADFQRLP